ncbi:hypothetical protein BOTBODRAFT_156893 [Botryobasidium botryosum FD-172 SS1]|uniref:CCAAT-binding factor domain-containing protein n=1 Tax=Botryobasidium botryosum (strain FD-172 SS1) TaxID=930990 RepID=A0A067ML48_BOTB1|nr:hypothetical protein BOTBODRAFT_156893 [Botryobasidium botryosum FD-172 SS1]
MAPSSSHKKKKVASSKAQNVDAARSRDKKPRAKAQSQLEQSRASRESGQQTNKAEGEKDDHLLQIIRALGGDDEDYNLVKDLDSDDVGDEDATSVDPKLSKDIASFIKSLKFSNLENVTVVDVPFGDEESSEEESQSSEEDASPPQKEQATKNGENARASVAPLKAQAGKPRIEASGRWYDMVPALPPKESLSPASPEFLAHQMSRASDLHANLPAPPTQSSSDNQFLSQILTSGTLSDRLSALTLMAQSSPIHNTRALESLKTMASKKGREESLKAVRAIVDWWVGGGAPSRKLKYFADQPLTHPNVTETHLVYWYFEDWLKKYFFSILQILETLSVDLLPYVRTQAMSFIFQLLKEKPEQEHNLLRLLVNKLGDSEKPVASKASYHLLQLLQAHPAMKFIVVREISALILRPASANSASTSAATSASHTAGGDGTLSATQLHARYYGVITFNQTTLVAADQDVAAHLVDLYFQLFRDILNMGDKSDEQAAEAGEEGKEGKGAAGKGKDHKGDRAYRRKEKARAKGKEKHGKGKGKQPEGDNGFTEVEDADSKMISALLTGVNRAFPFAKMEDAIFDRHIDTLFRITHRATFNVSIQALMLIQQVVASKKTVSDRFYRALYESLIDPRLANSSKQAMYLNLLFKAVKADPSQQRVAAFVKRILQGLEMHQPAFICGTLYLLGELVKFAPLVQRMLNETESELRGAAEGGKKKEKEKGDEKRKGQDEATETDLKYDPRKRDPQYAHAETSCLWELMPYLNHFHPSVSLHARQLLTNVPVTANADLALNTLSHFLDRFVYKNPKKNAKARGASSMQPAAAGPDDGTGMVRLIKGSGGAGVGAKGNGTMNDEAFWKKKVEEVPVDQLFFHKFFSNKLDKQKARTAKAEKRKAKQGKQDGSDDEDGEGGSGEDGDEGDHSEEESETKGSDLGEADEDEEDSDKEEAEIWKAMQASLPGPDLESDVDDSDDIPSGLDDISDSDESGEDEGSDDDAEEDIASAADDDSEGDDTELMDMDDMGMDDDDEDIAGLIAGEDSDAEESEAEVELGKRKKGENEGKRKRRKMGNLPTFASYEDYAKMIEDGPEDNIGRSL